MPPRKKPNPEHHNYGRVQSPRTILAGQINWLKLQITGAFGSLQHCGFNITRHPEFKNLKSEYQEGIHTVLHEIHNNTLILKDLADQLHELNGPDKWKTTDGG